MLGTCQGLKERKFVKPKILPFCELLRPAICSIHLSQHHPHAWYRLACSEQGHAKTVLICKYTFETEFECIFLQSVKVVLFIIIFSKYI